MFRSRIIFFLNSELHNWRSRNFSAGLEGVGWGGMGLIFTHQAWHLKELGADFHTCTHWQTHTRTQTHTEPSLCHAVPAAIDLGGHQTCTKHSCSSIPLLPTSDSLPLGVGVWGWYLPSDKTCTCTDRLWSVMLLMGTCRQQSAHLCGCTGYTRVHTHRNPRKPQADVIR